MAYHTAQEIVTSYIEKYELHIAIQYAQVHRHRAQNDFTYKMWDDAVEALKALKPKKLPRYLQKQEQ